MLFSKPQKKEFLSLQFLYPLFLSSFTNEKDFEPLKSEDPGLNVNPKITILLFFFK